LPLDRAPELRGFVLNMNQERLLARFPGLTIDRADEFGVTKLRLNVLDPTNYRKESLSLGRGDRGVQSFSAADPAEGRLFMIDNSKFPDLKGVRKVQLHFLDGRISYIQIGYDDAIKWNNVDEFAQTISKTLGLPGQWGEGSDSEGKKLQCDGFQLTATLVTDLSDPHLGPQLSVEDRAAPKMIEKREKDQEEKTRRQEEERRKTFKP
jgi:hypothetical protein